MNNFVDYLIQLTTQADADDIVDIPLDTSQGPMTLVSAMFNIESVAGSPTAITLDVDLTDGTVTRAAIAAAALGTAAARMIHRPLEADQQAGNHIADQELMSSDGSNAAMWRAQVDLNFTGGSTPTVTGELVLRFAT